jgi:DNA-binding NarL/FixJ family response regulator
MDPGPLYCLIMDIIHVIIADKSQLVRMALTGILYQIGFTLNIREAAEDAKLKIALQKDHTNLLIISKSFLNNCSSETIHILQSKRNRNQIVLINDNSSDQKPVITFDYTIEYQDIEQTIYQKLDVCIRKLSKPDKNLHAPEEISLREKEVLKLVALGLTNKEIGERLFISTHTVITHRKNITAKLGIKTIAGLTVYSVINKLIRAEEIKKLS